MKLLLVLLLAMVATSVAVNWLIGGEPGYVFISYASYSIELSFKYFVILTLIALVLLYAGIRFAVNTFSTPRYLASLNRQRLAERDRKGLIQGLIALAEGHWAKAEKKLLRAARRSDTPLLNYLAAARAAQMLGGYERRDEYLRRAYQSDTTAKIAVGLSQAELQLAHNQPEQALATLNKLREDAPRHDYVLKLLAKAYHRLEDWDHLFEILKPLRKSGVVDPARLAEIEQDALMAKLEHAAHSNEVGELQSVWQRLPKAARQRPTLVKLYAQSLMRLKAWVPAERALRTALAQQWDEDLIYVYGLIQFSEPGEAAAQAEQWLKSHPHSTRLLLTLGRLYKQARLWGKARSYLESSLSSEPLPETYRELGDLLEQTNEPDNADKCYRAGLLLAVDKVAEPPRLLPTAPSQNTPKAVLNDAPDVYSV